MTPWHQILSAQAILSSCMTNPPKRVRHENVYALTSDEWTAYDRADPRVAALDALHNQCFLEAEKLGGPYARAAAHCISVDEAIALVAACFAMQVPARAAVS